MARFGWIGLVALVRAEFDDSNFLHWFADVLDEVYDHKLSWAGDLPSYVRGTFVQSGPGRYVMGDKRMTHAFDGYSKISRFNFGSDGVTFSSSFLRSAFYNASIEKNTIVPSMLAGYTDPRQSPGPWGAIDGANDNNYIKCHMVGDKEMILSDTSVATVVDQNWGRSETVIRPALMSAATHGQKWQDDLYMDGHICVTGIMAHGQTDPLTGRFTGELSCMGLLEDTPLNKDYHLVFDIDPQQPYKRNLLAKIALPRGRGASYMHSMAQTQNNIILFAEPLHMSVSAIMAGKPLSEGAIKPGDTTILQIVNRTDGTIRTIETPGFLVGHVANAWEDGGDILMDVSHYEVDERMFFLGMFKFENLVKEVRDEWQKNKIMRIRIRADDLVDFENMLPNEPDSMFELLTTNPRNHGKEYCVMWSVQAGSNAYDEEWNSTKVGPAGAYGLAKRNFCTGERSGFYEAGMYPSEPQFIPNPNGSDEEDGVLVGIVFDSYRNTSFVQAIDAKTMKRVARAELHTQVPFLVHSTWFPAADSGDLII